MLTGLRHPLFLAIALCANVAACAPPNSILGQAGLRPCEGPADSDCAYAHQNFASDAGLIVLDPDAGCSAPSDADTCSLCATAACCAEAMACAPNTSPCDSLDACVAERCSSSCPTSDPDGGAP